MRPGVGGAGTGRSLWLCLAIVLAGACVPQAADAHAVMIRSSPANAAAIPHAPARLELWFNERLEPAFQTVTLESGDGPHATDPQPLPTVHALDPADDRHLVVPLPPLAPGRYVVTWRVLSRDGHTTAGQLRFRVTG